MDSHILDVINGLMEQGYTVECDFKSSFSLTQFQLQAILHADGANGWVVSVWGDSAGAVFLAATLELVQALNQYLPPPTYEGPEPV